MSEKKQVAVVKKEIGERVLNSVQNFQETGQLSLPKDYNAANAIKAAMLNLNEVLTKDKKPVLEACTQNSIANALLKMVIEGLTTFKSQGYFIAYGNKLTWSRSYQGNIALARRVGGVKDVQAHVIYQADKFEYKINTDTGKKNLVSHDQKLENIDNEKIKGAYAIVIFNDGTTDLEVMTIQEIEQAWKQGFGKGDTHKKFTQEMAKKTVINRACKGPINSSSDANLITDEEDENKYQAEAIETEEAEFEEVKDEGQEVKPEPKQAPKDEPKEEPKKETVKPQLDF